MKEDYGYEEARGGRWGSGGWEGTGRWGGPTGETGKWGWLGPDPTAGIKGGWRDWAAGVRRGGWGEQGGRGGM